MQRFEFPRFEFVGRFANLLKKVMVDPIGKILVHKRLNGYLEFAQCLV